MNDNEDWPCHLDMSGEEDGDPVIRYYREDIVRGVLFLYSGLGVLAGIGAMSLIRYLRS